jgi:hypothetical protein
MHPPSKSCGPSAFQTFVPIAQRGIPFIATGAQTFGCHTSGGVRLIDPFASQNFPPTPQPQTEKGLSHPRQIHSTSGFCVTTPPAPVAFLGSLKLRVLNRFGRGVPKYGAKPGRSRIPAPFAGISVTVSGFAPRATLRASVASPKRLSTPAAGLRLPRPPSQGRIKNCLTSS